MKDVRARNDDWLGASSSIRQLVKRLGTIASRIDVGLLVGIHVLVAFAVGIWIALLMMAFWLALLVVLYRPEWLRDGVFALSAAAFVTGLIASRDAHADIRFYEAVAQLVPVVFIALAVEIHAFRSNRPRHPEDLRPAAVIALALVYAEYEALHVLATDDARHGELDLIVGALAAAAVGVVLPVLLGRRSDVPSPAPTVETLALPTRRDGAVPWRGLIVGALLLLASRRRRR